MKRLLSIWLRNWPIQRRRNDRNDRSLPSSAPVILWSNDPRRGRLVVACCPLASQLGVRVGIAIAQATELVTSQIRRAATNDSLPPVVCEHDPVADSVALDQLAANLQSELSPLVAIETLGKRRWAGQVLLEPDTLFCDLSGVTHLFDGEPGILAAARRCLQTFGWEGQLAIADNAAAAWALAHYNHSANFISNDLIADIQPLSVNGLRIETETKHTLDRLGIDTIGGLLRLPRGGLAQRLGDGIVRRLAEVLGEVDVPLRFYHAEQQHQSITTLEYPTDDLSIIADRVNRLTATVIASLSASRRGALRLVCHLGLADQTRRKTVVGLFAPTLDQKHIQGLIQSGIESLSLASPICKIGLTVLQSATLQTQQQSLFASSQANEDEADAWGQDSASKQSLGRLIDTLSGRLGSDAVLGIRLSDNPLPERAYRTYCLTDHQTRKALKRLPSKQRRVHRTADDDRASSRHFYSAPTRHDTRRRPMKLLRSPLPLRPIPASNSTASGRQNTASLQDRLPSFELSGRLHRIVYYWGPERIETGWWDGPSVRRDYYRVETDSGHLWWIFRDLATDGKWFLHGRFS
ncbi:DNA polymerase Y family protein [Stieleria sp. TO1_6]|uniref:Y-family DNA polymerase n=1 Tax=Stieleria tagensis TaxID=2956795 RepID=UPI00209AA416|nr:DNA polymerase Y family protein [Stieleria tagensis]MCO8124836.1 DNA polymerase Y family protein [Stieleria tagensis]